VILFQWLTLPVLGLLLARDGFALFARRPMFRRDRLIRCVVWAAAFVAILDPGLTSRAAQVIGVQRGTDLVLYVFVLAFLGTAFYFYSQSVRFHRQLTEVVRHLAITEARNDAVAPAKPDRT
jgi:hypothetical protein